MQKSIRNKRGRWRFNFICIVSHGSEASPSQFIMLPTTKSLVIILVECAYMAIPIFYSQINNAKNVSIVLSDEII